MKLYYIFSQKTSLLFYQVCIKSFIIFYNSLDFLGRYIPELSLAICAFYPDEKTYPWAKLFYTILWSKITLYFSIYVIRNNTVVGTDPNLKKYDKETAMKNLLEMEAAFEFPQAKEYIDKLGIVYKGNGILKRISGNLLPEEAMHCFL